jgi:hypothetical protein
LGHVIGAYPGSFDPPTIAHLAIADAARRHADLARVDFVLSRVALGKESGHHATLDDRVAVLNAVAATRPWLGVHVTDAQLIVDVAAGYDVLILGADKWAQVIDPAWYGRSTQRRDEAVARLPRVLVFDRPLDAPGPTHDVEVLHLDPAHHAMSSSAVRSGRRDWMLPEAAASGLWGASGDD